MSQQLNLVSPQTGEAEGDGVVGTYCKDCVFATFEASVPIQTGCKLNRLEKLANNGGELLRRTKDNVEFYFVRNRICLACRDSKWAEQNDAKNLETIVRAQMTIRTDVIIPIDKDYKLDEVLFTCESVINQELLPGKLIISIYQDEVRPSQIIPHIKQKGFPYSVTIVPPKNRIKRDSEESRFIRTHCLEEVMRFSASPFYAVFEPAFEIPKGFLANIDRAISDNCMRFIMLRPGEEWNGLVIQRKAHDVLANVLIEDENVFTIRQKIEYDAKENGYDFMIKDVGEICKPQ